MLKNLYTLGKVEIGNNTGVRTWTRVTKFGKFYRSDDGISLPLDTINKRYEVFETLSEVELFLPKQQLLLDEQRRKQIEVEVKEKRLEKLKLEAILELRAEKQAFDARLNEGKRLLLKRFRLKTLQVPKSFLKKVMFSVSGSRQFKKTLYDPTNDDEVFNHITMEQLDEVFIVLDQS
tara:strand:- start:565 stop:1095 length:531 start_codon:yes stop_codon:yes gene_type:complete